MKNVMVVRDESTARRVQQMLDEERWDVLTVVRSIGGQTYYHCIISNELATQFADWVQNDLKVRVTGTIVYV